MKGLHRSERLPAHNNPPNPAASNWNSLRKIGEIFPEFSYVGKNSGAQNIYNYLKIIRLVKENVWNAKCHR